MIGKFNIQDGDTFLFCFLIVSTRGAHYLPLFCCRCFCIRTHQSTSDTYFGRLATVASVAVVTHSSSLASM